MNDFIHNHQTIDRIGVALILGVALGIAFGVAFGDRFFGMILGAICGFIIYGGIEIGGEERT